MKQPRHEASVHQLSLHLI